MTPRWRPAPTFPCAGHPLCPAKVEKAGAKCSVHKVWTNGPYHYECDICHRPIVAGELFRLIDENPTTPGHSTCLGGRRHDTVKPARTPSLF